MPFKYKLDIFDLISNPSSVVVVVVEVGNKYVKNYTLYVHYYKFHYHYSATVISAQIPLFRHQSSNFTHACQGCTIQYQCTSVVLQNRLINCSILFYVLVSIIIHSLFEPYIISHIAAILIRGNPYMSLPSSNDNTS